MRYIGNVIRPPSEADSLILQATIGCAHNKCIFCGTYRGEPFRPRALKELYEDIRMAKKYYGSVRRVFLADGDAIILPTETLLEILKYLKETFPELQRVGIYARATDILLKTEEELNLLSKSGLKILYVGLESGSDIVLDFMNKGYRSEEAINGCKLAQKCGMKLSTIILLGIGGKKWSDEHAEDSAKMINEINPKYLSVLSLMILHNTPLHSLIQKGEFGLPGPEAMLKELYNFVRRLSVDQCIFRSNHASNYLSISGTLKKDKERIENEIEQAIKISAFRPEFFRGL